LTANDKYVTIIFWSIQMSERSTSINTDLCVKNAGGNRFDLVLMASARAREIRRQHASSEKFEHLHTAVTALLEFQDGKLGPEYIRKVK
jgi:DNA-directed RNA polymerase subunit K/omega